ncbi:GTPase [Streptomyces pathocidini]|uniref:GTPase n=2 Tax=Streptomyces pathocidini TaxID=1650571 RepID=A0ABW7UWH0_9ACTN
MTSAATDRPDRPDRSGEPAARQDPPGSEPAPRDGDPPPPGTWPPGRRPNSPDPALHMGGGHAIAPAESRAAEAPPRKAEARGTKEARGPREAHARVAKGRTVEAYAGRTRSVEPYAEQRYAEKSFTEGRPRATATSVTVRPTSAQPSWDDGLIARRARREADAAVEHPAEAATALKEQAPGEGSPATRAGEAEHRTPAAPVHEGGAAVRAGAAMALAPRPAAPPSTAPHRTGFNRGLRQRLEATRELVGLSRARLEARTLAEASHVLEEAAARHRLSLDHTVVAIAGASGSGKSSLFNSLIGAPLSEAGVRRPTTSAPIACSWSEGSEGLLDRLGVPPRLRRRPPRVNDTALHEPALRNLVLIDMPDHDSAVSGRREQVDRLLGLVDAVVWVVDPEKYADAVLHERYLRPLAGYSEVTFVVLNQVDRLPGEATDQVLDDLRRLLDEDGIALGEHGEPGATVLPVSAATGEGVGELRRRLGEFSAEGKAAERRLTADLDGATERLSTVFLAERRPGLTEESRAAFEDRLAEAVGAVAAGQAAEREWLRHAELACGAPWAQLKRRYDAKAQTKPKKKAEPGAAETGDEPKPEPKSGAADGAVARERSGSGADAAGQPVLSAARAMVGQAVRAVSDEASEGLPDPWAQAVREAAVRGGGRLPDALDKAAVQAAGAARPTGPGWWSVASALQGALLVLQVVGALWLVATVVAGPGDGWLMPALLMAVGVVAGPALAWCCRLAARGPARRYGQEAERRLRGAAASSGRARVLEPVAAELLRYREVRDQYFVAAGGSRHSTLL